MVLGFVVILVVVLIFYYAYSEDNSKFAATASALRQVWSGGCRLSCRPSERSRLSGLSGLPEPPCQAGTSRDECVCDTCPCAIIENLLKTCSPATRIYTGVTNNLSHYCSNFCKSVTEIYDYTRRVLECGPSCQRQAQIATTNEVSSENYINEQHKERAEPTEKLSKFVRSAIDISKSIAASKKSSISFKQPLEPDSSDEERVSKDFSPNKGKGSGESISKKKNRGTNETLKSDESPESNCPRCVEDGNTCISDCPRAKKH